jgi:flagellar basal body P-ring formation protein FlgA
MTPQASCLRKIDTFKRQYLIALFALISSTFSFSSELSAKEDLEMQVRQWIAAQQGFKDKHVQMTALDPRLQIRKCEQALQIEQPFVSSNSVKVVCSTPAWQMFISIGETGGLNNSERNSNAQSVQKVLVSKELLRKGTLVNPLMFVYAEMPAPGMELQLIHDPKILVNMELARDLAPNTPLRTFDLKNAILVKRGQEVTVTAGKGQGFLITIRAESLQDGGMGDLIKLKNSESGRTISAIVSGPGIASKQ